MVPPLHDRVRSELGRTGYESWKLPDAHDSAKHGIVMSLNLLVTPLAPPVDGRQSETALSVARGTSRLLRSRGFSCLSELPLPSGRRADLVALNDRGEIWIVEIKSSLDDLRADQKWPEYRAHCDRLFFAFTQDLPCEVFPANTGLIVADAYGAHMHCEAPEHRLPAPTRKLMTVRFAIAAAQRINRLVDPQGHGEF